jgi:Rieske Fe-S protein
MVVPEETTRRLFLAAVVFTTAGVAITGASYLLNRMIGPSVKPTPFEKFRLGDLSDFIPGSVTIVKDRGVAVVRGTGGGFRCLSITCTHSGCLLGFNASEDRFECPCHGSQFSRKGVVLHGPATKPLQPKPIEVRSDGSVWAAAGWV